MQITTLIIASYLLGSIPFGYLFARWNKVNILEVGSKSMGASNVWREVGWQWGILTFLCDFAKGYAAVWLIDLLFTEAPVGYYILAGGLAALGHYKSMWLHWKGGKAVATSLGVLINILPIELIALSLIVFVVMLVAFKYVSAASISASMALAVRRVLSDDAFNQQNYPMTLFVIGVMLLITFAHKQNIRRLYRGKETKLPFPKWLRNSKG